MRYKHSWSSLNWPLGWKILQHLWMHLHLDYQLKTVFWCISHISCSPKLWLCLCLCFVFAFSPSGFICFILYFLCCCVNECILLSLFRVRVSVFVFVFCPCLCICYFLMSNKNVSRLVLSPDSLPTAFALFFHLSPVSVGVFGSYSVSLSCSSVSLLFGFPRGPRGLLFCCCLCFFSDVPLSFCCCLWLYLLSLSSSLSLMSNENVLRPSLSPGGREAWLLPRHFFSTSRSTSSFHYCFSLKYSCQYSINISFFHPGKPFSWHRNFLILI